MNIKISILPRMLEDSKITEKKKLSISVIQKYIFWIMFLILPLAIMPFPWDWTEKSMSLVILILSTIIVSLEIIKLIWNGKITITKSILDIGSFATLLSMILSTLFSRDIGTSLWGVDGRLGSGLIVFISILLVCFCARTFLVSIGDVKKTIFAFLVGLGIIDILSIFTFLGVNVWGIIPVYKDLNQDGLPLLRSSKIHMFVNLIALVIQLGFVSNYLINKKERMSILVVSLILASLSIFNIWIYSINQGIGLFIIFFITMFVMWFFVVRKIKMSGNSAKNILIMLIGITLLVIVPVVLLQIDGIRSVVIPSSINLVAQVSLGADVSWVIAASVFISSFWGGLFGMGVDTYTVAYNLFKPLNANLLAYNDVNFYYAGNEIFTKFSNGGFLWLLAWLFFGFLIVKMFRQDILKFKLFKDNLNGSWILALIDIVIIFIFFSGIFVSFSVLVLILLFGLITLHAVVKEYLSKETEEKFIMKLWTANITPEANLGSATYNLNIVMTIIVSLLGSGLIIFWGAKVISSAYVLKAESYYIQENNKYKDTDPTMDQRKVFVTEMTNYYSRASQFDPSDPVVNRKTGLMYLEMVGLAAEEYSTTQDSEGADNTELIANVGKWKNYAVDYTRKAIDTDNSIYANWEARAKVYMGLVGMGFYDYSTDATYSLEEAEALNPLNYDLYYSEAQIQVVNGDSDEALASLTKVLSINPQHVPAMVLAAELNKQNGNNSVYESYLKAAKKVLETLGQTNTEAYQSVTTKLNAIAGTTTETEGD